MMQYLIVQLGGRIPYIPLVKLAFFADRLHVRTHARLISSDAYYAFKLGPGGSNLMNLVNKENAEFSASWGIEHPSEYDVTLSPNTLPNEKKFSISDLEAIHFALKHFGELAKKNRFDLPLLSHAYPEWTPYESAFLTGHERFDISYLDFLKNADKNRPEFIASGIEDPFPPLSPEEAADIAEEIEEYNPAVYVS